MGFITLSAFNNGLVTVTLHNAINRDTIPGQVSIPTYEAASIRVRGKSIYYGQNDYPTFAVQYVWQEAAAAALANAHDALRDMVGDEGDLTGLKAGGGTAVCTAVCEWVGELEVEQQNANLGLVKVRFAQTGDWA